MGWRYTRKSRRRDTQKLPLMTHGNAAGAIVRYWPPHSATSYVASSYVYGSTCDTIVPFSMRNMLQCAWSGPLVRCAVHCTGPSSHACGPGHLPEAKRYCFHCKNKFLCAALHYETPGLLSSCFILPHFINKMADAFCPQPITIPAILSYCGSALDVALNYSLLAINVVGFGASYRRLSSEASPSLGIVLISFGFGEYTSSSYE